MNHSDIIYLGVAALLVSGCCSLDEATTSSEWMNLPLKLLSSENAYKYARKFDTLVDYQAALRLAEVYGDEENPDPLESIVKLWCQGSWGYVESLWYVKDDRISRCLIMMLLLSDREDDRLGHFIRQSGRYERHECDQRREEILFVAKKRDEYSRLVKDLKKQVEILEQSHETNRLRGSERK